MYILRSGKVAIKKKVPHGEVTLAVLEKGDFFGEMAILERMPRSASAEMIEDGDLVVIGGEVFGDMIKNTPEIAVRMLRKYSIRLRETTKQIVLYSAILVAFTVVPFAAGWFGAVYLAAALVLGAAFLALAVRLRVAMTPARAAMLFHFSLLYLAVLFVAAAVDPLVT